MLIMTVGGFDYALQRIAEAAGAICGRREVGGEAESGDCREEL